MCRGDGDSQIASCTYKSEGRFDRWAKLKGDGIRVKVMWLASLEANEKWGKEYRGVEGREMWKGEGWRLSSRVLMAFKRCNVTRSIFCRILSLLAPKLEAPKHFRPLTPQAYTR